MIKEIEEEVLEWYENKEDTLFVIVILVMLNCKDFIHLGHMFYIGFFASAKAISKDKIKGCEILTLVIPFSVFSSLRSLFYLWLILKKSRVLQEV